MGISPHAVVNAANSKMLIIERIAGDRDRPTPERMVEIALLVDEYRASVAGSTTDPFRAARRTVASDPTTAADVYIGGEPYDVLDDAKMLRHVPCGTALAGDNAMVAHICPPDLNDAADVQPRSESALAEPGPANCLSTYGDLACSDRRHTSWVLHRATLPSGQPVTWGKGCDATCTTDCGWCKGELRRSRERSQRLSGNDGAVA